MDEGRAGHMQAHRFEQHLVGVGGAVEGAGAGAVVGRLFGLQQSVAPDQALRGLLADLAFGAVRQAAAHRSGRHKHAGQMAKVQRTDQQAGHDLVAHTEQQRAIEHVVRQRDGGGHGDRVAREQRQLHAGQALRHAVAHRRHAAGHLQRGAKARRFVAQQRRVGFVGLVRRQHVVVGADNADVRRALGHDTKALVAWHGGEGVGDIGAAHPLLTGWARQQTVNPRQIGLTGRRAAQGDALGDKGDGGLHGRAS